ncbi:MAG: tRNA threonylcarbamoyladenosine dehydratase [Ruminococcaceae bacterium]|nr:tRNA threonylcarbamoyladenosine dehydratase [Oscillospiraceae bacterium]
MDERFIRAEAMLGADAMEKLRKARIAVVGLGGVGSWCVEALARCGVGELILLDQDKVSVSNRNRQLCALEETVGRDKTTVMAARVRSINPACRVTELAMRYEAESHESLFSLAPDFIVDAIDLVACKLDLIESALTRGIPIVSALGTGNKCDASQLRICDISKTEGCPFARVIRRELRRRGINHLNVVFSAEEAADSAQSEAPPPGRRSVPGSLVWVPATAGMLLAQHVVLNIADGNDLR